MKPAYSPAEAAADLAFYSRTKLVAGIGSPLLLALPALALWTWNPWFALALAAGAVAGVANMLLSLHGNERLIERRNLAAFVLSSFVRIALFGMLPVVLAVRYPSVWVLACYFGGFFTPLGLFAIATHARVKSC